MHWVTVVGGGGSRDSNPGLVSALQDATGRAIGFHVDEMLSGSQHTVGRH